ncbi:hypothetical protein [Bifidobacterium cuniculi]|nr:hypothetical protein [Bifidobacterium cuniculi]
MSNIMPSHILKRKIAMFACRGAEERNTLENLCIGGIIGRKWLGEPP